MPTDELSEALTAANASAFIAKQIDPLLLEYQRRYSPLIRALPSVKWGSNVYYFNTRVTRVPGGFVADGGARPVGASVYQQAQFNIRQLQAVGAVTGFAQEVTRELIGDLRAREIEGAVQSLLWDVETGIMWGCDPATAFGPYPQFSGLDTLVAQFTGTASVPQNASDENGAALALGDFDQLIDMVETNAAAPIMGSEWMFVVSPTANSKVAQLLTNQQRFDGLVGTSVVAAGLTVPTYRDVPIVKSSFLSSRNTAMGAVTSGTATTGGSLAAGTYYYKVEAIIARAGETAASAEVSQVTTGSASTVTLSFTPPVGYESAPPIAYKVFRGTATGGESLLGVVDANVGLGADGVTPIVATSIVDTGSALVPQNGATVPAQSPSAYVGTNTGHLPRGTGLEDIYLLSRDPDNVIRPFVRDVQPVDVYPTTSSPDSLPFALVDDTCLALRAPKYAGRLRNVNAALS